MTRSIVQHDGREGLLIEFASGGVTPGDAYLIFDDDGRPSRWLMWVSIIPVGGVPAEWQGWQELEGGAWVSTAHSLGPLSLTLSNVGIVQDLAAIDEDHAFDAFE